MEGTRLIQRVRFILKDKGDTNVMEDGGAEQGQFWDDEDILLALNAAQDVLVNFGVRNKSHIVNSLIDSIYYMNTMPPIGQLPEGYLHYNTARVGNSMAGEVERVCNIYLGGECLPYFDVLNESLFIYGNLAVFRNYNASYAGGWLFYYRRPSYINREFLADRDGRLLEHSFPRNVYEDFIVNHAATILGLKEVNTQRDYKLQKRNLQKIVLTPESLLVYNTNKEISAEKQSRLRAMQEMQMRQNDNS